MFVQLGNYRVIYGCIISLLCVVKALFSSPVCSFSFESFGFYWNRLSVNLQQFKYVT